MEGNSYKRTQSINSIKKQNKFKNSIMSFSSEQDSSLNSITSSPKASDKFNNNSLYSSFKKYNKTNNTNNDNDSKKNVSEESSVKYLKKYSPKIKKSISYAFPPLTNLNNNVKENSFDLNNNNTNNNNNNNNYIVFNGKNQSLRNISNKLNSGKISTVKEEQEQEQTYLVDNMSNNILTNIKTEEYKIQIYYEGKYIDLTLNKNDKFKKLILLTQKKLFPYHQIVNYDILYKLNKIDIVNSFNVKLADMIGEIENNVTPTFLLMKKDNIIKKNHKGTSVTIENFPSLTDLAIDLNYFFKKETRESDFIVDYKKNICKVVFSYPEKAFSLVSFLSQLKLQKPIYKRLKVNLDYHIKVVTNAKKKNQPKIMLPLLKKKIINNLQNDNFYIKDPNQTPSYRRKNIKMFLPNYFSFSKKSKLNMFNDEVLFLYRKKQNRLKNVNSDVNIKSYKDKDYINNNLSDIKNKNKSKKILSIFDKDRKSVLATKKVRRNSVFYNMPIEIKINNENNNNANDQNNDSINKSIISKNSKKNDSNKNVIVRSLTNKDYNKSKFFESKDKKNNNAKNSINNDGNSIANQDNKNKDLYLMKLIQDAKMSDESSSFSNKSNSSNDTSNNKVNKKSFFNGKNQEFMFFKGLSKRPKRKYNEYIGKKDY